MHLTRGTLRGPMALVPLLALAACGEKRSATADSTGAAATAADSARGQDTAGGAPAAYAHAATITGFKTPESVRYDADLDTYFVSNINGNPSQKDGNGFISRIDAANTSAMTVVVQGGKGGV